MRIASTSAVGLVERSFADRRLGFGQQHTHLVVAGLAEIVVPAADRAELRRRRRAYHVVGQLLHLGAAFRRRDRNRHHDARRLHLPQRLDRDLHGGAGGEAVVDQDGGLAAHIRHGSVTIEPLAPRQLLLLARNARLDRLRRKAQPLDQGVVQHLRAAGRDRAHRQLLVAGGADLAHQEHIERRLEGARDLESHRHAATRQCEDQHVRPVAIGAELGGKLTAGIATVAEQHAPLQSSNHGPVLPKFPSQNNGACNRLPPIAEGYRIWRGVRKRSTPSPLAGEGCEALARQSRA